jgi:hypothetical protein
MVHEVCRQYYSLVAIYAYDTQVWRWEDLLRASYDDSEDISTSGKTCS